MDASSFRDACRNFLSICKPVTVSERNKLFRVVEVVKRQLQLNCTRLVSNSGGLPILCLYQGDGTPKKISMSSGTFGTGSEQESDAPKEQRSGSVSVEFFSQVVFLKTIDVDNRYHIAPLVNDPRPLYNGKSTWFLHSAAAGMAPLLCEIRPGGINISAYVLDRGVFSSLGTTLHNRHTVFLNKQSQGANPEGAAETKPGPEHLLDWVFVQACVNHDCHNAYKWGVLSYLANPVENAKILFVAVESLRNSFGYIILGLSSWLKSVVDFDGPPVVSQDNLRQFWSAHGLVGTWLENAVALNPYFQDGRMHLPAHCQNDPTTMTKLSNLLLYVFKFTKMNDSRWATLGGGHSYLASCLVSGLG